MYAMKHLYLQSTQLAGREGLSRVRNPADFLCMHAVCSLGRHFACMQCIPITLPTRDALSGQAFRLYANSLGRLLCTRFHAKPLIPRVRYPHTPQAVKTTYIICQKKSTYYKNLRKKIEKSGFFNKKDSKKKRIGPKRLTRKLAASRLPGPQATTTHLHNEP